LCRGDGDRDGHPQWIFQEQNDGDGGQRLSEQDDAQCGCDHPRRFNQVTRMEQDTDRDEK
jgi:hypothetical protein